MGFYARVRRDWFLLVITVVAPVAAVYFLLPARPVGPEDLEHPAGRFLDAEVTFDRIEPLPWSFHDSGGTVHTRFALGWIGKRALLVQTGPVTPQDTTLRGNLHLLSGEPKKWVRETPAVSEVAYDAVLDITRTAKGVMAGIFAILFSIGAAGAWLWRFVRPIAPEPTAAGGAPLSTGLDTFPPRTDEVVAAVVRTHAPGDAFAGCFALYALLTLALPFLAPAIHDQPHFWDAPWAFRPIGMFALGFVVAAPVSIWAFVWWARRRRAGFDRLARDGVVTGGVITDASVWLARSKSSHTVIEIDVASEGVTQRYRGHVRRVRDWARPGTPVRVLATPNERHAIVIAPTGEAFTTRRADSMYGY